MPPARPVPGNVLHLNAAASVQFAGNRALTLRVIRVHDWPTYHGWMWLDGYVLDRQGKATERRSVFVQVAGVILLPQRRSQPAAPARNVRTFRRPGDAAGITRNRPPAYVLALGGK